MKTEAHVSAIEKTYQLTHEWLREIEEVAGLENQSQAYSVLRGVLHALRDRLPHEEMADLGAQLPMLIRGVYYEGWRPASTPTKERSLDEFLAKLPERMGGMTEVAPEAAVSSVFKVLHHHVTQGEIRDVRQMLPEEVRGLWPVP